MINLATKIRQRLLFISNPKISKKTRNQLMGCEVMGLAHNGVTDFIRCMVHSPTNSTLISSEDSLMTFSVSKLVIIGTKEAPTPVTTGFLDKG